MIYFDNNATTSVAPQAFDAMRPYLEQDFGNPSSAHGVGRTAKQALERARGQVAALLGVSDAGEIVFTSGGTESDNWSILGAIETTRKRHIITTHVEHEAVRKLCENLEAQGYQLTWLEVDGNGRLDLEQLKEALTSDTAVVSTMLANNETGILFPIREIGQIVKEHSNAIFHVDGVNAVGKVPIDLSSTQVDLFSVSGHKFHAPKGIGALYIRKGVILPSSQTGGGQESGRRAGTEAVHQIGALGAAAEMVHDLGPMEHVRKLRDRLESEILERIPNSRLNGTSDPAVRLPNTSSISFENTNGEMVLAGLDDHGICVSTGSACNAHDHTASAVLQAMEIPYSWAMGSIRFSLGRFNTAEEVERVIDVLPRVVEHVRSF